MRLIIFTNGKENLTSEDENLIRQLNSKSLVNFVTPKTREKIPEELEGLIDNTQIKMVDKLSSPPYYRNFYEVREFPTIVFDHAQAEICRWTKILPNIDEVVLMVKNYIKVLEVSIPEVDWSIDED